MALLKRIYRRISSTRYARDERGLSIIEFAILFPVLLSMMMAVYDLGQGIVVNQKTVAASQVIGDLITRYETVDTALIEDIVKAGELTFAPYSLATFGYDIVSVEYDEEGDPFILWRVTENMEADEDAHERTIGLGTEGEGVVMVSIVYEYVPYFSNFIVDAIGMTEQSFLRGRKSVTVPCTDCG